MRYPPEVGSPVARRCQAFRVDDPHAERAVLLPSSVAWSADARLVGEALRTLGSASARTLDDTRFVLPALTWQIAADTVADCATEDHRAENLRILVLPAYVLDAAWACRSALAGAAGAVDGDPASADLADVLALYLHSVQDADLPGLIEALDRILAVLTLDLPAAHTLMARLALNVQLGPDNLTALDDVLAAWRRAGVAC
jgi:hypothetical protein